MNKKKPTIWLCGGIDKAPDLGRTWRDAVTPKLEEIGYEVLNPLDINDTIVAEELGWSSFTQKRFQEHLRDCSKNERKELSRLILYENDFRCVVEDTDVVLVYWDEFVGPGTISEVALAGYHGIPVVVFRYNGWCDEVPFACDFSVTYGPYWSSDELFEMLNRLACLIVGSSFIKRDKKKHLKRIEEDKAAKEAKQRRNTFLASRREKK